MKVCISGRLEVCYTSRMEIIIYLILLAVLGFFVYAFGKPMLFGAPYAATDIRSLKNMIEYAHVLPGERACDLGSGDGRLVIELTRAGAEAHGYEINPMLVWYSRRKIQKARLTSTAFIHRQSLWKADLSGYSLITLFGIPYIMKGLEKKLLKELPDGARVMSNHFAFPNWKAEKKENGIYIYTKKST